MYEFVRSAWLIIHGATDSLKTPRHLAYSLLSNCRKRTNGIRNMGFIRQQEENLAIKLLKWQYQRMNYSQPEDAVLERHASKIVDDAHRIGREKGRNVLGIIKELISDLKRK